jgi:uncharacterized protein (DUF2235 family)
MPKNVVICCDGTSNEFAQANTNVVKLFSTLVNDPERQLTFYHPGLGTMGPPGAITEFDKYWTKLAGLSMGYGLANDIRDAYVFLMENFREGDQLYIFGFSRGAYTARSLAAVLHMYGLIRRGNDPLVPYAVSMMKSLHNAHKIPDKQAVRDYFELASHFRQTFSQECKPHFVGVWDTVSSVGWVFHPLSLPYTANNPDIAISCHAVAIDERRGFFPPNLWRLNSNPNKAGPKMLKQVWFSGSHSDVGGGYPEAESEQSKYALEWMIVEARDAGLLVDPGRVRWIFGATPGSPYVAPSVRRPVHESLTFWWKLTEVIPKPHFDEATGKEGLRMNLGRRRQLPAGAQVHESAYLRGPDYVTRLPPDAVCVPRKPA